MKYIGQYLKNIPSLLNVSFRISQLQQPIVTIFGGKRVEPDTHYYRQSYQFGALCAQKGMSVLTGGGPGIMESALCGARDQNPKMGLGIGVQGIDLIFESRCGAETLFVGDFAVRKHFLIEYSQAFIVFPGGVGTLDEFLEVLNLIKTKKITPIPIVLIGSDYWKSITEWFRTAQVQGLVPSYLAQLFYVCDENKDALKYIVEHMKRKKEVS